MYKLKWHSILARVLPLNAHFARFYCRFFFAVLHLVHEWLRKGGVNLDFSSRGVGNTPFYDPTDTPQLKTDCVKRSKAGKIYSSGNCRRKRRRSSSKICGKFKIRVVCARQDGMKINVS